MRTSRFAVLHAVAMISWTAAMASGATAAGERRPNILWIVAEDMSPHFACYGETAIATPNFDRLAREGTLFRHAFATAPVCSPVRSALITGMYQTTIGAHHHRSGGGDRKIRLPAGVVPIPVLFQKAGYFTSNGPGMRRVADSSGTLPREDPVSRKTDYNFEWDPGMYDGSDWAERRPGQPFFAQVQLAGGKMRGGGGVPHAERFATRVRAELGKPTDSTKVLLPPYYPRDPILLRDWADYLDCIRLTDLQVGAVLARLEEERVLEDTLVCFVSDHGISHARGKQFLYDEGTRVPLLVRGPGVQRGAVREDLIASFDLAAISLAAAGIALPSEMQAQNALARDYSPRSAVFAARDRCDETVDRIRSLRTDRFLYIRNFHPLRPHLQPNAYKDGKQILQALRSLHAAGALDPLQEELLFNATRPVEELYEWRTDRWQVTNLAGGPEQRAVLEELRTKLERWMIETKDRGPEADRVYDAEMRAHLASRKKKPTGRDVLQDNIALMKQWAAEGR